MDRVVSKLDERLCGQLDCTRERESVVGGVVLTGSGRGQAER